MPRRKKVYDKKRIPDVRHNSILVSRTIQLVMWDGKKSIAKRLVYGAMDELAEKTNKPALEAFEEAIKNVSPLVELKARRIGGANYQVPIEVKSDRSVTLALRWIVGAARDKSGQSFAKSLAQELIDSLNMTGTSIKKKEDTHRMAEANKAFAYLARY